MSLEGRHRSWSRYRADHVPVGWRRESDGGKRWLSLAIHPDQRAEKPQETRATAQPGQSERPEFDDAIPF